MLMGKVAVLQPSGGAARVDDKAKVDTSDKIVKERSGIQDKIRGTSILKTAEDRKELKAGDVKIINDQEIQKRFATLDEMQKTMEVGWKVLAGTTAVVFGMSIIGVLIGEAERAAAGLILGGILTGYCLLNKKQASDAAGKLNKLKLAISILDENREREAKRKKRYG